MLLIMLMKTEQTFQTKLSKNSSNAEDTHLPRQNQAMKTCNISATMRPFSKQCGKNDITIS